MKHSVVPFPTLANKKMATLPVTHPRTGTAMGFRMQWPSIQIETPLDNGLAEMERNSLFQSFCNGLEFEKWKSSQNAEQGIQGVRMLFKNQRS